MAQVTILRPGMMMTVQDAGRTGLMRFGVSGSGPMDPEAMAMANALVGNDTDSAAALEFAFFGGEIRLDEDRQIAVCGAVRDLSIDGSPVAAWQSHLLRAGQKLAIGAMPGAVWGYIAISGGLDTPPVLGARATHLRTAIGGLDGRVLRAGDHLSLGTPTCEPDRSRALLRPWRSRTGPIRVVLGPQDSYFSEEVLARFLTRPFTASAKRDRMAMVLEGPALPAARGHDIVSDGTVAGSVQVPGSGQPMVLMADRQTTGGYPKIATIAHVDLPRLSQLPVGRSFRFQAIAQAQAEDLLIRARQAFRDAKAEIEAQ